MSREARPVSTALRTPPGHASGVEASSAVTHVQFSYGLKGPQEAGSGCACRKKPHQHLLAPLVCLALGPLLARSGRHGRGCPCRAHSLEGEGVR